MQGIYEHGRDNNQYPTCWHTENDGCMPHFHSSIEVVYVTDGELKAVLGGKTYTARKNQILISSSYTVHYYHTEDHSKSIILVVPLDFIPSYEKIFAKKAFARCVFEDDAADSEILHCMEMLSRKDGQDLSLNANITKGYIYVILGLLVNQVGLVDIANDQSRHLTKDILIYLQNNYLESLSLESLALKFGYSKSRFSHVFNACFGCTITEYINTLRCRNAANLLIGETPMIDAAMSSGFESMRTFYRCFKRCFGVTPTQYCSEYFTPHSDSALFHLDKEFSTI